MNVMLELLDTKSPAMKPTDDEATGAFHLQEVEVKQGVVR